MRLIIRDLKKTVDGKTILENASFSFRHGVVYGLIGNRNSERTDFLKCICGESKIDGGFIRLEADWKEYKIKYSDFGIVSDVVTVPEYFTGYELFECYRDLHPEYTEDGKDADYYLNMVGLAQGNRDKIIKDYSEYDKKRIQFLAVLLSRPSVIIIDEPYSGSTGSRNRFIKKILKELKDRIIIIATDNQSAAEELCDEYICIEDGRIRNLSPDDVKEMFNTAEEDNNA